VHFKNFYNNIVITFTHISDIIYRFSWTFSI